MKKIVIVGSSRSQGNTMVVAQQIIQQTQWDLLNLNDYNFSYYDYEHNNREDDFLSLVKQIIEQYDTLIFATPVYWYAMSGIMKVFFDRLTDLITIEKDLGRQMRGKKMAAISSSTGEHLGEHFWLPFSRSADYLGMAYLGHMHTIGGEDNGARITAFLEQIGA